MSNIHLYQFVGRFKKEFGLSSLKKIKTQKYGLIFFVTLKKFYFKFRLHEHNIKLLGKVFVFNIYFKNKQFYMLMNFHKQILNQ